MTLAAEGPLWRAVDRLLARAEVGGVLAHGVAPLAAYRLRRLGEPVPAALQPYEQLARMATLTAIPLLRRLRDLADGPLVLVKGAEVASLYPGLARSFGDIDLLAVEGRALHTALKQEGFVESAYPDDFSEYRHLHPLQAPRVWLEVEIHVRPIVPDGYRPPPLAEVVEASVPSAVGVEGVSAPHPAHHALMLAAHAWDDTEALLSLRDLIDVAAVAQQASDAELSGTARAWGLSGIWETTRRVADALFAGGRRTTALRIYGRHLEAVRERTVLENHLWRWCAPFSELPIHRALLALPAVLGKELRPDPGERWTEKVRRVGLGVLHPQRAMSVHTGSWRRDPPDADRAER